MSEGINDGRGKILKVYTPAENQQDWENNYRGKEIEKLAGLENAVFVYGWPIGEIIFEYDDVLTHIGKVEKAKPPLAEEWQTVSES